MERLYFIDHLCGFLLMLRFLLRFLLCFLLLLREADFFDPNKKSSIRIQSVYIDITEKTMIRPLT